MSLVDQAATGSSLAALKKLRDMLAHDLDICESMRDKSSLSQRFMDVLEKIDELGGGVQAEPKETGLSDFEQRLRAREATASTARRTKSG